jgi:UDP-GlcNAc:undecaprenyl-phosphate/decaprenyl-phosphate GlcNAc-1-phosphate transferase
MGFLLIPTVAFIIALIVTPLAGRVGGQLGIVDVPGPRRLHQGVIPRLGGVGLYVSFSLTLVLLLVLPQDWLPLRQDPKELTRLTGMLIGCTFMFLMGLLDDRRQLGPLQQFVGQLVAAGIASLFLIFIERVMNPFSNQLLIFPWPLVVGFTFFWIVGMVNTVNWLDGLDGLAGGVTAIACAVLTLHMVREGQYSVALLPLALLGSLLGFLPYNFHPARVFMGSSGSSFLGFAMGTLSIISGAKMATVLLVMGIPIIDVAWQILNRLRRQAGTPWQGDLGHLHYRLLECGLSQRQIVGLMYAFSACFGLAALVISSRMYKLYALLGLGAVTVGVLIILTRRACPPQA